MLKKKLFRTIGAYKAQFISMIIMITLGVGMFVGFNMEWLSIQYNMNDFFEKTGYADYFLVSEQGFSAKEAGKSVRSRVCGPFPVSCRSMPM